MTGGAMSRRKGQQYELVISKWLAPYGYENRNRSGYSMKPHLTRTMAAVVIAAAASITLPLLAEISLWLAMAGLWAVAIGLAVWVAPAWCRHWADQPEPETFAQWWSDPRNTNAQPTPTVNPSHSVRFDPHRNRIIREDTTE